VIDVSIITKITNLNHQGQGITKVDNIVTFVPKTVKDDVVELEITKKYKNYNIAKKINIINSSKDRVEYDCPYYDKCGGCNIANLSYDLQLKFKKEKVINIFKKYNKIDINPEIIPSFLQLNYRNKVTLQIKDNILGFYEEKTNNIISIDNCKLLSNKINDTIKLIKLYINIKHIDSIVIKDIDSKIMINIFGNITNKDINILKDYCDSLYINSNYVYGEMALIQPLNSYKFMISPDSFFQININQTINLYNQIVEYTKATKKDKILDLYCGTGTIGIYLSKYCDSVLGIEINNSSIENAIENKKLNNINNISFKQGDVSKVLDLNYKADIIVVDPPRSGLDKKTINTILKINPKRIVYVSCNPITLSRDINILKDKYELRGIKIFDMFPQTYHCETICVLERR
jgi:23S rRNA (uracil1939-C5)-methyltransferase